MLLSRLPPRGVLPDRPVQRGGTTRREFRIPPLAKKVFIKSYGCQMNVYDAGRMADVLAPAGYAVTEDQDAADLIILNTCHIREKAAEKVYSELGRIRRRQEELNRGKLTVAVAGCVAQAEGEEILRRAGNVDLVVGPQSYHRLPELLDRAHRRSSRRGVVETDFPVDSKFDHLPVPQVHGPAAFLTIQEGCDKFCAFCVVPYTRGAEYSRPAAAVIDEARRQVEAGVREITLLGQNVNAYHGIEGGLAALVRALAAIDGLERIRYTTSHPRDMDDALIDAHGDIPELMPYLHLPVQSGSDSVLVRMNRRHTVEYYLRIVEKLRQARPDIALSSDFIVGHPGETAADFEATLDLVRAVGYAQAYSFKYSPRPGTPAADMDDRVTEEEKTDRLARLQSVLNECQLAFNRSALGTIMPVLFDRHGKRAGQIAGRTPYMQAVHVDCRDGEEAASLFGTTGLVAIGGAHANSLTGRLVPASSSADGSFARETAGA